MQDLFSLKGKVAIVTGGNGGIGKGIASGLAGAGAGVVVAARNPEKTAVAVKEIAESVGAKVVGVQVDVTRQEQIQSLVEQTLGEFGRIDILVNNAGINIRKMPQDYLPEEWDQIMDANLRAPFLLCQAVYPSMKKAGGGKIINIGSMTTIFGGAKLVPYGTSKGGIVQMTRALAAAWAPDNIQVNAVLPGWIDTPLTRQARIDLPGLNERVVARTPAGRWGDPNDFRGTAVFLASPASDFLTGVALPVDGGYSIMIG
jgi:2-deoxy-D-gluconate 3-dehydrogenase